MVEELTTESTDKAIEVKLEPTFDLQPIVEQSEKIKNLGITSDKKELKAFLAKCDKVIISIELSKNIENIDGYDRNKLITPIDFVVSKVYSPDAKCSTKFPFEIEPDDLILDIGSESIAMFKKLIENADTVTAGDFKFGAIEMDRFAAGTNKIKEVISNE